MKEKKVCFNKSIGIILFAVLIAGLFLFGSAQLLKTHLTSNTRASASNKISSSCTYYDTMSMCSKFCKYNSPNKCKYVEKKDKFYSFECCESTSASSPTPVATGYGYLRRITDFNLSLDTYQKDFLAINGFLPLINIPPKYSNCFHNIHPSQIESDGRASVSDFLTGTTNGDNINQSSVEVNYILDYIPGPGGSRTSESASIGKIKVRVGKSYDNLPDSGIADTSFKNYLYQLGYILEDEKRTVIQVPVISIYDDYMKKRFQEFIAQYGVEFKFSEDNEGKAQTVATTSLNDNGEMILPITTKILACQNEYSKNKEHPLAESCIVFGYDKIKSGDTPKTTNNSPSYTQYPDSYQEGGYVFKYFYLDEGGNCR